MTTTGTPSLPRVMVLASAGRTDLPLAGGKGAGLGELVRAGIPVPPGFVVTTEAYRRAVAVSVPADTPYDGKREGLLREAAIPRGVEEEILHAYDELGGGAVAVRSSATAEDLAEAAFAGQQETFLNVTGAEALMDAIRSCWASLWSERAVAYRQRLGMNDAEVAIAVVVQRMVAPDAAGVMFTADPVTGRRDTLLIDAAAGLGEAVVSGMVTPHRFVLAKKRLRLLENRPGRQELVIRAKAGGGTEVHGTSGSESGSLMPRNALRRLAREAVKIERHFGAPQDIEWAWVRDGRGPGTWFILQSRPMTALADPVTVSPAMRRIVPMLMEMWPSRPFPLDMSTFTGALEQSVGRFLASLMGKSAPRPEHALVEEDGVVVRFEPPAVSPSPGMLLSVLRAFWRTRRDRPEEWSRDPVLTDSIQRAAELDARDVQGLSWDAAIHTLDEALDIVSKVMELRDRYVPPALMMLAGLWLRLVVAGRRGTMGALLGGVRTMTTETNEALEELAARIRADAGLSQVFANTEAGQIMPALKDGALGRSFLGSLSEFLARYGHREISLSVSDGSWRDHPETVIRILMALAVGAVPSRTGVSGGGERARDAVLAGSLLGTALLRRGFLRSLEGARALFQLREDTHFYATLALPIVRKVVLELGRRLADADALPRAQDVFHLRLEELQTLGGPWPPPADTCARLRELAARRSALRDSLASRPLFAPGLLSAASPGTDARGVILTGTPGSPGTATGRVRIIRSENEFHTLAAGEILVAPVTNPAWTPLFARAAAVVADAGGAASHAAIVAREYGVPAVMGTGDGTRRLRDGQVVTVDGTRGLVTEGKP